MLKNKTADLVKIFPGKTGRLAAFLLGTSLFLYFITALLGSRLILRFALVGNIGLAMLPAPFAALLLHRSLQGKRGFLSVLWGALWLVFFPNAPYMLTDGIHIALYQYDYGYAASPVAEPWLWLVYLLFTVAVGCTWGYLSLYWLHNLLRQRKGKAAGWLFCAVTALLSGTGIYMGRFIRLNSWDVLHPLQLAARLWAHVNSQSAFFILLFAAMTAGGYLLFYFCVDNTQAKRRAEEEKPL